ncbi:MAG TPA: ferritin-like protein [Mycobacteriales bacterium]|jgi:hypothetical protein|nr:ferritin-like protein [Mycobacteriales bacterium]
MVNESRTVEETPQETALERRRRERAEHRKRDREDRERRWQEECQKIQDEDGEWGKECAEYATGTPWVIAPEKLKPIETVESLAAHLYLAAQVEMSTIPLYLYAAWSIRTKGYSQWAPGKDRGPFRTILGVAIEEMSHLALVRNLIVAIGYGDKDIEIGENKITRVKFYDENFVPRFPRYMLHRQPPLCLGLHRLSTPLLECAFMPLEKPQPPPLTLYASIEHETYHTLGEFYEAIWEGFECLDRERGKSLWEECHPELQYYRGYWNQFGGGTTLRVTDLNTAQKALTQIIEQGEGAEGTTVPLDPTNPRAGLEDWSHYEKFRRLAEGIDGMGIRDGSLKQDISIDHPLATWPVISNPRTEDYENCDFQPLMELFNAAYCYVLAMLDEIYATPAIYPKEIEELNRMRDPDEKENRNRRYGLERSFVAAMQGLLYPIADLLVRTPTGRKKDKVKYKYRDQDKSVECEVPGNAGPPFEYYEFAKGKSKKAELVTLCKKAMEKYPALAGDDGVLRQINLLTEV